MKWLLIFWALPVSFLGLWYGLSYYDLSFGIFMLTREAHDLVFHIYGNILGVPPDTVPYLAFRAIVFDTFLVMGIIVWRKRAPIMVWWKNRSVLPVVVQSDVSPVDRASEDSLSRAP